MRTLVTVGLGLFTSAVFALHVRPWLDNVQTSASDSGQYSETVESYLNDENNPLRTV